MPGPEDTLNLQLQQEEQTGKFERIDYQRAEIRRLLEQPYTARIIHPGRGNEIMPPVLELHDPDIPRHQIRVGLAPFYSSNLPEHLRPITKTWPSQSDPSTTLKDRWFDTEAYYWAYHRSHDPQHEELMLEPRYQTSDPVRLLLFYVSYHKPIRNPDSPRLGFLEDRVHLAAGATMYNAVLPQRVELPAFAVDPDFRKMGIGELLVPYMAYVYSKLQMGLGFYADTNEVDSNNTSGVSPAGFWERQGFGRYGRLETYGTGDPDEGNAL